MTNTLVFLSNEINEKELGMRFGKPSLKRKEIPLGYGKSEIELSEEELNKVRNKISEEYKDSTANFIVIGESPRRVNTERRLFEFYLHFYNQ